MQERVYDKRVNDVDELCQCLLSVWHSIGQNVIDEAIDQWRLLVLWLDILSQFWIEHDLVVFVYTHRLNDKLSRSWNVNINLNKGCFFINFIT